MGLGYASVDRVISRHLLMAAFCSFRYSAVGSLLALKMEQVCDRAMDGDEAMALPCRLEPDHASFSSSNSQMRILRRLFTPLCERCSTLGMISLLAAL
jgi:transposase